MAASTVNALIDSAVTVALSNTSTFYDVDPVDNIDITSTITGANHANVTFTSAGTNTTDEVVTSTAHGLTTGAKVTLTTSNTLPTGLATGTDYYIIVVDANTIAFATSQANALAGTKIDLTGVGTGTHTVVVTTALAGSVKLQKNNEPSGSAAIWVDVASSSTNFSAAGSLTWSYDNVAFREIRTVVTVTSGTVLVSTRLNGVKSNRG